MKATAKDKVKKYKIFYVPFLHCMLASSAKGVQLHCMCEYASPRHALQVQCLYNSVCLNCTQGFQRGSRNSSFLASMYVSIKGGTLKTVIAIYVLW